jgi:MFS family permease
MGQTAPASPPRDAAAGLKVNYLRSWLSLTMTLLVICYLLNMVMGLPRAGLPRVLTYYVGASAALMSLVELFVFGVGKCMSNLVAGWMADAAPGGRKGVVLIGASLITLGCLSIYCAVPGDIPLDRLEQLIAAKTAAAKEGQPLGPPTLWWPFVFIALGQFLNGLGSGFQNAGIMIATQDLGGRARRGLAGGLMEAAVYWGVTAGTFLGGWLVSMSGQLLFPFLVMAVIAACCMAAATRTVDTRKAILESAGLKPAPITLAAYRVAFSNRSLYVIYLAGLLSKWVDSMIVVMSSLYLNHLGYSVAETAVIQTGFVLSWSTASLFTGALSDFIGRKNLIWMGMLWNAIFTLVLLQFSRGGNLLWELGLTVLLGCGTGFYYGLPPAIAADVAPLEYRGVCISIYRFWRDSGNILAPLAFAAIYWRWGETLAAAKVIMLVSAGLLFVGASVALAFMRETHPAWQQGVGLEQRPA